jgi:protein-tyrosine phosphatase
MAEIITRTLATAATMEDRTPLVDHLELTSAGTGPWHDGEPMHTNTALALRRGGYPDHSHVARQFPTAKLTTFDLLVALDRRHQQTLRSLGAEPERIKMLRSFDPTSGAAVDVPDPYYGDDAVFDDCRDMIAAGCSGLVTSLTTHWAAITIH